MLAAFGFSINNLSLFGMVLAIGIVVDDAIVVLENIYRFIEEKGMPPAQAAVEATQEIGLAVLATTLSLVAIFAPVGFMSGMVGRFMQSFGLTMAFAIMVSLLVSFTLTPMLASRWLKAAEKDHKGGGAAAGSGALIAMALGMYLAMAYVAPSYAGQSIPIPAWVVSLGNAIIGVQSTAQSGFAGGPGAAAAAQISFVRCS